MIHLTSPNFSNGENLPQEYTCEGKGVNPPLKIENVPAETKGLVLLVEDPDAPCEIFTHWLVWNINPQTTEIEENSVPAEAVVGVNSRRQNKYTSPCPPSGIHHYIFKIFALDIVLDLPKTADKEEVEMAMDKHVLDEGGLTGLFGRDE